jgi:hypothetical protein
VPVTAFRWISLVCTGITLGAAYAHVLELPNKFRLDGELWLAVQQNLYRGWGPFIGPFELLAIAATWLLVVLVRGRRQTFVLTLVAALCLSLALVAFFTLNAPVNAAFAQWTPQTLPADWPDYRLRWEVGHAVTFVLALIAFILLLRAAFVDAIARVRRNAAAVPRV